MAVEAPIKVAQLYDLGEFVSAGSPPVASSLNALVNKALEPYEHSPKRLILYPEEGSPYSSFDSSESKEQFRQQAQLLAYSYTKDILNSDGSQAVGSEQIWSNLLEIVPSLVRISIDPQNYTEGALESHALNPLAAALLMARNPSARITGKVGIGGSDAAFTPARFLTYGIPSLKEAEAWNNFYQQREARVLIGAAVTKKIASEEQSGGISKDKKKAIRQEVTDYYSQSGKQGLVETGLLDEQTIEEVRERYAIARNPFKVQFIFTPEAALSVNFKGKEALVRAAARRSAASLQEFVGRYFPSLADDVDYLFDISWDQLPIETMHSFDFNAKMIEKSTLPSVIRDKELLGRMASNHGSGDLHQSVVYAAMHKFAFSDKGKLPVPLYMAYPDEEARKAAEADTVITRGCRGEVVFNSLRRFMAQYGTEDAFRVFLQDGLARGQIEYEHTLQWLDREIKNRPFSSKINIWMIDSVARQKAGYYPDEVDIDAADLSEDSLQATIKQITTNLEDSSLDKRRRIELASIRNDYQVLLDEINSR